MAKGKRSVRRAEDIIASHAMKHHDFVGGADAERQEAEKQKEARVHHEHEKLEQEVVHEMTRELEEQAGVAGPGPAAAAAASAPASAPASVPMSAPMSAQRGVLELGREVLEEVRANAPRAFEALRTKAEERLAALPPPVKRIIHRSEQAAALLLAPARIGVALARELFRTPLRFVEALRRDTA
jgi:hypothetical protein